MKSPPPPAPLETGSKAGSPKILRTTRFALGSTHTCALTNTTQMFCFGNDYRGQSTGFKTAVARGRYEPDQNYTAVRSGAHHSCAIDVNEHLRCWGASEGWSRAPHLDYNSRAEGEVARNRNSGGDRWAKY